MLPGLEAAEDAAQVGAVDRPTIPHDKMETIAREKLNALKSQIEAQTNGGSENDLL